MNERKTKVAVGLSGGVDSSIAAALLKDRGYDVVGMTMKTFDPSIPLTESVKHACYGPGEEEDVRAAAAVCEKLGIPFHTVDLKEEFRDHVIAYFRREYLAGRTPNPCIFCNHRIKFGLLLKKARNAGIDFEFFATGHYARIAKSGDRYLLKRAADLSKDQTYFLYALTPEQLSHTFFPVGEYTKPEVREIARSLGLRTADRPESQDFISGADYSPLFREGEIRAGDILDEEGNVLGRHRGIVYYTVGQRRGLGIASPRPLYVLRIDASKNRIVVTEKENLFSKGLIANHLNLIAVDRLDRPYDIRAKIRLQHKEVEATLSAFKDHRAEVRFHQAQLAVTPGQSVVFYLKDIVLGGGIIEQAI
ncbi:MAG: tRNA 2-thiouridine(34) synthase MnmA [Deltaproteobacteria bacterium]|nr:tRNA 2-thiouridine(34) synthase MnmA [Deltaproteobacteria bacterium]